MMIIIIIFYICDIQYFLIFKAYEKLNFCLAFIVSLVIIIAGLYKTDYDTIQSGTSLFFFMLAAFAGTVISEIRKRKLIREW